MKNNLAMVLLGLMLVGRIFARSPEELARQYEDAHARKDLQVLMSMCFTNGAPDRAIRKGQRAEAEHLSLRITKTEIRRLTGDTRVEPQMMQMLVSFDVLTQTNGAPVIAQWARTIQRCGESWCFRVPETGTGRDGADWKCYRSRFSDSDIAHYRSRALAVFNDPSVWKRMGTTFEGPFELASEQLRYECEPAGWEAAKIVVVVPVKTKRPSHNATFVEITFERHMETVPEDEIVEIRLVQAL